MRERETIRTSFAEDSKITPGIVAMVSERVKAARVSFKERKKKGRRFYELLHNSKDQPKRPPKS